MPSPVLSPTSPPFLSPSNIFTPPLPSPTRDNSSPTPFTTIPLTPHKLARPRAKTSAAGGTFPQETRLQILQKKPPPRHHLQGNWSERIASPEFSKDAFVEIQTCPDDKDSKEKHSISEIWEMQKHGDGKTIIPPLQKYLSYTRQKSLPPKSPKEDRKHLAEWRKMIKRARKETV